MCGDDRKLFTQEEDQEWETWEDENLKNLSPVIWKTLISKDKTCSYGIVAGVFEVAPGKALLRHYHAEEEAYYILTGKGVLEIDDETYTVTSGTAFFIPGNAKHSLSNTGKCKLKVLYMFPADSFGEIDYSFIKDTCE
ncbi:MAG: cupin domain-containing protein [Desulfobacterales bacterium]|nr:cupin domain-containing protein [Desulfobacterales bacterium]